MTVLGPTWRWAKLPRTPPYRPRGRETFTPDTWRSRPKSRTGPDHPRIPSKRVGFEGYDFRVIFVAVCRPRGQ